MSSASTPSADEKARKIKSLLASYYTADQDDGDSNRIDGSGYSGGSPARTPSSVASQMSRAESAATPLNATYFDPDAYLKRMLKETRLADLTSKHRAMLAEVGSLDSDMQMLVYENYNKFVTATDTIKVMNSSMGGMDASMTQLKQLIDNVVEQSNSVNGKLQHRQDHIEELNQVRTLLHKLQGVFELPKKLRTAIDRGAYDVAVDSYADVAPLLKKYGHKAAFKKVSQEVEACAKELSGVLRQQLLARPDEAAECIQMIARLGEPTESLQEDFLACKRQRMEGWLQTAGLVLKTIAVENGLLDPAELGAVDESLRSRMAEWFPGEQLPPLQKVIVELDSRFLTELTHTAAMYAQLFEPGGRKRLVKMAREVFQRYLKLARRALSDAAATAAAVAAGISARGDPLRPLSEVVEGLQRLEVEGAAVGDVIMGPSSGVDVSVAVDWGTPGLMQALYVVKNDITRLDSILPELSPKDRASELVEHTVRQHVGLCFAALERRVLGTVREIRAALTAAGLQGGAGVGESQETVQRGLLILQVIFVQGVDRVLLSLKDYERERWVLQSWQDVFGALVQGQLQNLFLSVAHQLLVAMQLVTDAGGGADGSGTWPGGGGAAAGPVTSAAATVESSAPFASPSRRQSLQYPTTPGGGDAPAPPPLLMLMLCRLCQLVEREVLAQVLGQVQELFPERMAGREEPPAFVAGELGRRLSATSGTLLRGYVDAYGRLLTIAVRRSMEATDWINHKEPRAPRLVCDYILEKAAEADAEIACLTEGGSRSGPHSRASSVHHSHSNSGIGMGAGYGPSGVVGSSLMEAALSKALSMRDSNGASGALELSRPSLLASILACALRSMVESVRLVTLGRAGFQQIQLDVHYLRPRLQPYLTGGGSGIGGMGGMGGGFGGHSEGREVQQLLDELLGAAMERCSEPLMLDTAVLDRIVATAAAQRAQQAQQQQQPSLL